MTVNIDIQLANLQHLVCSHLAPKSLFILSFPFNQERDCFEGHTSQILLPVIKHKTLEIEEKLHTIPFCVGVPLCQNRFCIQFHIRPRKPGIGLTGDDPTATVISGELKKWTFVDKAPFNIYRYKKNYWADPERNWAESFSKHCKTKNYGPYIGQVAL